MTRAIQLPHEKLAALDMWLREAGELFVTVYPPLRVFRNIDPPRFGVAFFMHSVADIEKVIEAELKERGLQNRRIGVGIKAYRSRQYPFRGIAGAALLDEVLPQIADTENYEIVSLAHCYPPFPLTPIGWARGRKEFEEEFAKVAGQLIGIGRWGLPLSDEVLEWRYELRGENYELVDC
jgi:hypothetical protein